MAAVSVTVPCTTTTEVRDELDTMNVDPDRDATQQAIEHAGKRCKKDYVTKEMMNFCAGDAATRLSQGCDGTDGR